MALEKLAIPTPKVGTYFQETYYARRLKDLVDSTSTMQDIGLAGYPDFFRSLPLYQQLGLKSDELHHRFFANSENPYFLYNVLVAVDRVRLQQAESPDRVLISDGNIKLEVELPGFTLRKSLEKANIQPPTPADIAQISSRQRAILVNAEYSHNEPTYHLAQVFDEKAGRASLFQPPRR